MDLSKSAPANIDVPDLYITNQLCLRVLAMLVCLSGILPSMACAQSMFKCKQGDGAFTYQSDPCPQSSTQQELHADGRGNIKVVPPQARSAAHNASTPAQPAKLAQDSPSAPSQAQVSRAAEVDRTTSIKPEAKKDPDDFLSVFLLCLGLCFAAWVWYKVYRWWRRNEPYDPHYWWENVDWPFSFDFSSDKTSNENPSSDDS